MLENLSKSLKKINCWGNICIFLLGPLGQNCSLAALNCSLWGYFHFCAWKFVGVADNGGTIRLLEPWPKTNPKTFLMTCFWIPCLWTRGIVALTDQGKCCGDFNDLPQSSCYSCTPSNPPQTSHDPLYWPQEVALTLALAMCEITKGLHPAVRWGGSNYVMARQMGGFNYKHVGLISLTAFRVSVSFSFLGSLIKLFSAIVWPSALGAWLFRWQSWHCQGCPGWLCRGAARMWTLHSQSAEKHMWSEPDGADSCLKFQLQKKKYTQIHISRHLSAWNINISLIHGGFVQLKCFRASTLTHWASSVRHHEHKTVITFGR